MTDTTRPRLKAAITDLRKRLAIWLVETNLLDADQKLTNITRKYQNRVREDGTLPGIVSVSFSETEPFALTADDVAAFAEHLDGQELTTRTAPDAALFRYEVTHREGKQFINLKVVEELPTVPNLPSLPSPLPFLRQS